MKTTSLRTQITLSNTLREEIDQARRVTGESLSGYLNKAARERLNREQHEEIDLENLAKQIVGSIKQGDLGWGKVTEESWRKEREEEDEYRQERLNPTHERKHSKKRKKQDVQFQRTYVLRDK